MKNQIVFLVISIVLFFSCEEEEPISNTFKPLDYREFVMGDFQLNVNPSYSHINPNISNFTPLQSINLTVYKSTTFDNELIIDGIHNRFCVYATMSQNTFDIPNTETSLQPEDLGFRITGNCFDCKVRIKGSGSISPVERGQNDEPIFNLTYELSYDGFPLVRYSGNTTLSLPRPETTASDC